MPRVARHLPTLFFCLSALAATLWVRSYCSYDQFEREWWSAGDAVAEHSRTRLLSGRGAVYFFRHIEHVRLREPPATRPASSVVEWGSTPWWQDAYYVHSAPHTARHNPPAWVKPLMRLGLSYSREEKQDANRGDWPRGSVASTYHAISVPYWILVAGPAAWPTVLLARGATAAWVGRRRRRAGRCAGCGYDMRGSAGRCPECGATCGTVSGGALPAWCGDGRVHAVLVGVFLAVCTVACLWNLRTAAGREPPSLADERKILDRKLDKEVRRAIAQIRHPGTSRDNRGGLYYQVASFGTPEVVSFLAETYEEHKRLGRLGDLGREGPDLVFMLWGIRRPESADVLLRMLRDGSHDIRLVDAYTAVACDESVPHLRRLFDSPPNETVRYGAWHALLRRKDARAVRDYLAVLRPGGNTSEEVRHLYDLVQWAPSHNLTEAIPALQLLARHYGRNAPPHLRSQIIHTLLRLGHWASVVDAIGLLADDNPAGATATDSRRHIAALLSEITGADFGTDVGRWRRWWEEEGRYGPSGVPANHATAPPPPETIAAVERAFLMWAVSAAGRVVPGPVAYAQDESGQRRSTETIRYYREAEIRLLHVPRIRIDKITIDGDIARVSFYGPENTCGPGPTVELTRDQGRWTAKGYVYVLQPETDPTSPF